MAPICIHFYGLTKEELTTPFEVIEVPGLAVGADLNPNDNGIGYVILTQGNATDEESGVTISEQVSEWFHKAIVRPFVDALREADADVDWSRDGAVDELLRVVYSLDSDIPGLNFLKRPDVARDTVRALIDIIKIPAAATESYQQLDIAKVCMLVAKLYRTQTARYDNPPLKTKFEKGLKDCTAF